jgi:hypothetical protein
MGLIHRGKGRSEAQRKWAMGSGSWQRQCSRWQLAQTVGVDPYRGTYYQSSFLHFSAPPRPYRQAQLYEP